MKTPTNIRTTRASLVATAAYNTRWFASILAGTAVLGSSALADTWDGDVSSDWNDNNNWPGNDGNAGNATVNSNPLTNPPFRAIISANSTQTIVDLFVGTGVGVNARMDHTAGTAGTGTNNWMFVGRAGGTGVYNLADTSVAVATGPNGPFTGFGQGTGSFNVGAGGPGGRLYIGGNNGTGSNGSFIMNTTGTLWVRNQMEIGTNASVGVLNLDGGIINAGSTGGDDDWFEIGNGAGCTGTINMSGGEINKTAQGNQHFIVGANGSNGTLKQTGGTVNVNSEFWVANNANSIGTYNLSAGTINVTSWVAIGRGADTARGTVNMTGGTWNKTGATQFIVGANGHGKMTMSGGLVDVQGGGYTWVGEAANGYTGVLTISGTAEFRSPTIGVGQSTPAADLLAVPPREGAILNLDGGTVRTLRFNGARNQDDTGAAGGIGTVNFNGTQIIASGTNLTNFISNTLDNAVIGAGGLLVDTNNFNLTAPKILSGPGGVVKSGVGTLTLSGVNTFLGNKSVSGGSLVLSEAGSGNNTVTSGNLTLGATGATGTVSLADGTSLGVNAPFAAAQLTSSAAAFGTSAATTLNLNLGDVAGVNPGNSLLHVTGALAVNGAVTVNVAGAKFAVGDLPLLSYDALQRTGSGSFVLGTLPNGVAATIQVNPNYFGPNQGLVYLDVDSVALPKWNGNQADAIWTTANNWTDQVTLLPSTYADPNPVLFNDDAAGSTNVVLNSTVLPSSVLFDNDSLSYTLTGTGTIGGSAGLTKQGTQSLAITGIANSYTGVTRLEGGITTVDLLTNGGVASPLGAATSAASNLVLAGGTLEYTGATVAIDRGFSNAGADNTIISTIDITNDLTISGAITTSFGKLVKTGPGTLTLSNPGANVLAIGSDGDAVIRAFRLEEGALVFSGTGHTSSVTGRTSFGSAAGTTSVSLVNGANFTGNGRTYVAEADNSNTTLTVSNNSTLQANDAFQIALGNGSTGNVIIEDSGSITKTGGWLSIGNSGNGVGTMTVRDNGTFTANGDFNVSDVGTSTGTLNIEDSALVTATGPVFIGKNTGTNGTLNISSGTFNPTGSFFVASGVTSIGDVNVTGGLINHTGGELLMGRNGAGTWDQSAGTVNANGWAILGRDTAGNGTMNVSGGVFTQTQLDRPFMIGEFGIGTLNVSGTAEVNSLGANGLILANEPSGTGVVNLDGGILTVRRVREGNDGNAGVGGSSTFHFNGGVLKAGASANLNFLSGLNSAVVDSGGAFIDSNGQTIAIAQALDDGGGDLTKQGAGTLLLNGANSYFGTTTVAAGTLGGTGSVTGPLVVNAAASINPGASAGTFSAGDTATIDGTYICEIDGANGDQLAVSGALTIGATAVLDFNQLSAPTAPVYVIATYGSLSGTFTTVTDLPSGYSLDYNYLGASQIALVQTATPYSTWATSYGLDPLTDGAPGFDKDGDGQVNSVEFALGGSPISGSDNAKVYHLAADSSDGGSANELLMTIAVRTGTPAFTPATGGLPTATMDGYTYTIQGSANLASFTGTVAVVTTVAPPAPNGTAPTGYEWRTFSLEGSDGLPTKGFLRVNVTP